MIDIKLLQNLNDVFTDVMKRIFLTPASSADPMQNEMTWAQKKILFFIHESGPQKMSTIARQVAVAMSAATAIVDKMVKAELVVREFDPHDRRVVRIALSDKGKAAMHQAMDVQARCFEEILEQLEPHKRTELLQAFEKIHGLLSELQPPRTPIYTPTGHDLGEAEKQEAAGDGQ